MSGTLYGLGLGPGDPELVTIKAAKIMAGVPVISYVTPLRNGKAQPSFARSIAEPHLKDVIVEIPIPIAMLDDPGPGQLAYDVTATDIAAHLDAGRDVAFLCEGDPLLFGSFMYVLERLNDGRNIITVPGVSSLSASAAAANLPLVSRHQSLALIPGTLSEDDIRARLEHASAAAIFKVGRNITKIKKLLLDAGRMDAAVYIERASLPEQRVMSLAEAPDDAPYFSIILLTETDPQ